MGCARDGRPGCKRSAGPSVPPGDGDVVRRWSDDANRNGAGGVSGLLYCQPWTGGAGHRGDPPLHGGPAMGTEIQSVATPPAARRVLVVEDNRDAAESLRMLLELSGYEVAVAGTGPDG